MADGLQYRASAQQPWRDGTRRVYELHPLGAIWIPKLSYQRPENGEQVKAQLVRGARQIDRHTIEKFGNLLSAKLHDSDPTLRAAYLKLFVAEV